MPYSLETIHPLFIHFPIALLSTGLFFDIVAMIFHQEDLEHAGFWCMLMGVISCVFTNFTGLMAFLAEGELSDLFNWSYRYHFMIAWCTTLIFAILFWVRIKFQLDLRYSPIKRSLYVMIHILTVGILFYGAHLGAKAAERI